MSERSVRDDEPIAGLLGAIATAIAIVLPAYMPDDARDWLDEDVCQDNRYVSGPHGWWDEPPEEIPIARNGTSTTAHLGDGADFDRLRLEHGALPAPDDVCVDVQLVRPTRRGGALRLRVESSTPAGVYVSARGIEIATKPLATDDRVETCAGHMQLLELETPKRRRTRRIDVEVFLAEEDGTPRNARRSFDVRSRRTA